MTEFITRVCHGESRYEVIIKTDNEGRYKAAEKLARSLIGHEKPQTNADRIRAMSDEELAKWLCSILTAECCDRSCPARYMCDFDDNGLIKWLKQPAEEK